ncbi:MAG: hypothetical protein ACRDOK_30450 [Streptosporangiaceae bacterium]
MLGIIRLASRYGTGRVEAAAGRSCSGSWTARPRQLTWSTELADLYHYRDRPVICKPSPLPGAGWTAARR